MYILKAIQKLAKEQEFVSLVKDTLSLTRAGLISEAFFVDNKSQNSVKKLSKEDMGTHLSYMITKII